jgi:predicted MFS family arabinose efflux permease
MDYINRLLAPFSAYPRWLVYLCFGLAVVLAVWIVGKLLKWTLYLVVGAVVIAVILVGLFWFLG